MSEEEVSCIYADPENQLMVFGEEFTVCGSSVTLEGSEMEEGLLLFWGVEALSTDDIPKNPHITAEAVFRDGSTQTADIHLDLSGTGVYGGDLPMDEESGMPMSYGQSQYYRNLPLEECELVDEQRVTDRYEYTLDDYTLSIQVPERDLFDEDGQYRVRRQRISGAFYLPVFRLEGDTCAARLYRVPEELEYSPENEANQQRARRPRTPPCRRSRPGKKARRRRALSGRRRKRPLPRQRRSPPRGDRSRSGPSSGRSRWQGR